MKVTAAHPPEEFGTFLSTDQLSVFVHACNSLHNNGVCDIQLPVAIGIIELNEICGKQTEAESLMINTFLVLFTGKVDLNTSLIQMKWTDKVIWPSCEYPVMVRLAKIKVTAH